MADVLITGGTVVDGTGNPEFKAAVLVEAGRVQIIRGDTDSIAAERRIDAAGLTVAPGFIDMHSHSSLMALANPHEEPKIRQGVTTELIGIDGNSYAPFKTQKDLRDFVEMYAGLDGNPEIAYDWDTVASYLTRFDHKTAANIALLIGNSALRICAIGWDEAEASVTEVEQMRSLLREGMEEGAFGLSTGLDYAPGAYASTDELARLGCEAARLGGIYHTHVRYRLGDQFLDPFREAIEIGRRGDVPVHITHLYRRGALGGGVNPILSLVDQARADGVEITYDTYPYEWSSTTLLTQLPLWVQAGGPSKLKERLRDPGIRPRLRDEVGQRFRSYAGTAALRHIRIGALRASRNRRFEGHSLSDLVEERGGDPVDVLCDLLLEENLAVNQVTPGPYGPTLPRLLTHPLSMIGTDSIFLGEAPSPRTYGSYPRILGEFVRDEALLSLPEAIRKMTSMPAQRLGISDRGILRDGMAADIVMFDAVNVRSLATYDEPRRFPIGIPYVLVNGELVVDEGICTKTLPGRVLRRGRASLSETRPGER